MLYKCIKKCYEDRIYKVGDSKEVVKGVKVSHHWECIDKPKVKK